MQLLDTRQPHSYVLVYLAVRTFNRQCRRHTRGDGGSDGRTDVRFAESASLEDDNRPSTLGTFRTRRAPVCACCYM